MVMNPKSMSVYIKRGRPNMMRHFLSAARASLSFSSGRISAIKADNKIPKFYAKVYIAMQTPTYSRGTYSSISLGDATLCNPAANP